LLRDACHRGRKGCFAGSLFETESGALVVHIREP
jgi:hypothetical protein